MLVIDNKLCISFIIISATCIKIDVENALKKYPLIGPVEIKVRPNEFHLLSPIIRIHADVVYDVTLLDERGHSSVHIETAFVPPGHRTRRISSRMYDALD